MNTMIHMEKMHGKQYQHIIALQNYGQLCIMAYYNSNRETVDAVPAMGPVVLMRTTRDNLAQMSQPKPEEHQWLPLSDI